MGREENRSVSNLVVLCIKHADEIDLPERQALYPVDLLRQWKAQQVAAYDEAVGGWILTDEEAAQAVDEPEVNIVLQAETIVVGGIGGIAPGAAGGGGGAIGPGALGGSGGRVGVVKVDGVTPTEPGAGGGGGGSIAPGSIPWDPAHHTKGTEGQGYVLALDGTPGGDSVISLDGHEVLKASGGTEGLAGTGVRRDTDRLSVSAVMLVNYAEQRGLASIVGGGWQSLSLLNLPDFAIFPFFILFEAGGVEVGEYTGRVGVHDPNGVEKASVTFPVTVSKAGDVVRIPVCGNVSAEVDSYGLWAVTVATTTRELAHIGVMVKRLGEAEAPDVDGQAQH